MKEGNSEVNDFLYNEEYPIPNSTCEWDQDQNNENMLFPLNINTIKIDELEEKKYYMQYQSNNPYENEEEDNSTQTNSKKINDSNKKTNKKNELIPKDEYCVHIKNIFQTKVIDESKDDNKSMIPRLDNKISSIKNEFFKNQLKDANKVFNQIKNNEISDKKEKIEKPDYSLYKSPSVQSNDYLKRKTLHEILIFDRETEIKKKVENNKKIFKNYSEILNKNSDFFNDTIENFLKNHKTKSKIKYKNLNLIVDEANKILKQLNIQDKFHNPFKIYEIIKISKADTSQCFLTIKKKAIQTFFTNDDIFEDKSHEIVKNRINVNKKIFEKYPQLKNMSPFNKTIQELLEENGIFF